jgi:hypothetical protein
MLEKAEVLTHTLKFWKSRFQQNKKAQPIKSEASRIIELLILCEQKLYPDKMI